MITEFLNSTGHVSEYKVFDTLNSILDNVKEQRKTLAFNKSKHINAKI